MPKKPSSRQSTQQTFRAVSKFISSLNEREFQALLDGSGTLAIVFSASQASGVKQDTFFKTSPSYDEAELKRQLRSVSSSKIGADVLAKANLTRAELERLARSLDLAISKQDDVKRLEEKIVAALIGSRLDSLAVRGS